MTRAKAAPLPDLDAPPAEAGLSQVAYVTGDPHTPGPWKRPEPIVRTAQSGPLVCEADWSVVDHVCGRCFSRLLGRTPDGDRFYRCSGCGRESDPGLPTLAKLPPPGPRAWTPAICACQLRFGGKDAGIRCVVNDRRGPESPTEIVARQVR